MAASNRQLATGSLSAAGATALLVGKVIGVSIFTLPGPLAGSAGPSVIFAILLLSMGVFIVPGALVVDPGNYTPLFPHGVGEFGLAVVSLYFPLLGFSMIVALDEELHNPTTSIPRVLGYAAAITLTLFALLVSVFVGVVHHGALVNVEGAVVEAGRTFLPEPLAAFLAVGVVGGGLTRSVPRTPISRGRSCAPLVMT